MKFQIEEFEKNVKYSKLDLDMMRKNHDISILKKDVYLYKLVEYEQSETHIDYSNFSDKEKLEVQETVKFDCLDKIKKKAN